jgi:hypothetical protein
MHIAHTSIFVRLYCSAGYIYGWRTLSGCAEGLLAEVAFCSKQIVSCRGVSGFTCVILVIIISSSSSSSVIHHHTHRHPSSYASSSIIMRIVIVFIVLLTLSFSHLHRHLHAIVNVINIVVKIGNIVIIVIFIIIFFFVIVSQATSL